MRFSIKNVFYNLLIFCFIIGSIGCASRGSTQNAFKERDFKKLLQQQKQQASINTVQDEALERIPEMTAEEYEHLGDSYLRQRNIDMAYFQYLKSMRLNPGQVSLQYKIGRLFLQKGLVREAEKRFQEILKIDANNALAYEGLGQASLILGNITDAREHFLQAIQFNPNRWQAHNFLGVISDRQGKFNDAIDHYKAAIRLNPNLGLLFNNLGFSYYLSGDYDQAAKALEEAIRKSHNSKFHNNYALVLSKLGRTQEAFNAFKQAGNEATAYNNIGYIYMLEGKRKSAARAFEKAIENNPRFYVTAHENLERAKTSSQKDSQYVPLSSELLNYAK